MISVPESDLGVRNRTRGPDLDGIPVPVMDENFQAYACIAGDPVNRWQYATASDRVPGALASSRKLRRRAWLCPRCLGWGRVSRSLHAL